MGHEDAVPTLIINLAGEGEIPSAVNINNYAFITNPRRMRRAEARELVVHGDYTALPLRDGCAREVIGSRMPTMTPVDRFAVIDEALRVLMPGGRLRLQESAAGGQIWLPFLDARGIGPGTIVLDHAVGVKP